MELGFWQLYDTLDYLLVEKAGRTKKQKSHGPIALNSHKIVYFTNIIYF